MLFLLPKIFLVAKNIEGSFWRVLSSPQNYHKFVAVSLNREDGLFKENFWRILTLFTEPILIHISGKFLGTLHFMPKMLHIKFCSSTGDYYK